MSTLAIISLISPLMLWGAAAAALPIAAHLMHRRAVNRITFPTIRLLHEAAASQSRLFRLRRLLLLLLRCIAIALITLAFARPIWTDVPVSAAGNGNKAAVVVVLDVSASTAQRSGGISAIERLRGAAQNALTDGDADVEAGDIVYAGAHPEAAFPQLVPNLQSLRDELRRAEPTQQRADLLAAVGLASDLLADHKGPRRITVVSDMQKTNWAELLATPLAESLAQRSIRLTIAAPPTASAPVNAALSNPHLQPGRPLATRPAQLIATLTDFTAQQRTVEVTAEIDGHFAGSRRVTTQPNQPIEFAFEVTFDTAGEHRVTLTIPDDDFAADNRVYLIARVSQRVPIVVVGDDDAAEPTGTTFFLTRALAPHGDATDPLDVRHLRSDQLNAAALADTEAVLIGDIGALIPGAVAALRDYTAGGGGVLMFCGTGPVGANATVLQQSAGAEPLVPWTPVGARDLASSEGALAITDGAWSSPALLAFDERSQDSLAHIRFKRIFTAGSPRTTAATLLRFADSSPALSVQSFRRGKFALANFSPEPASGDLVQQPIFVALVHSLVDDLRPRDDGHRSITVGKSLIHSLPLVSATEELRVLDPDGRVATASVTPGKSSTTVNLSMTTLPGFYTVERSGKPVAGYAANLDERESDLRTVDAAQLASLAASTKAIDVQSTTDGRAASSERGLQIWPYLVEAALIAVSVELLLLSFWKR